MCAVVHALAAQSGGPSPVINASLLGVIEACRDYPERIGRVLGAWHGVEGILREELIDLVIQPREELRLLRQTPAAGGIGTCRYKMHDHTSGYGSAARYWACVVRDVIEENRSISTTSFLSQTR